MNIITKINEIVNSANAELAKITKDGFPFSETEVKISVSWDSAGVYVHSGSTPVCALARTWNHSVLDEIRFRVNDVVAATRTAVERRGGLKAEMDELAAEGDKRKRAIAALEAAGLDTSILGGGVDRHSAELVVKAAEAAVVAANQNPPLGVVRYKDWQLTIKGFLGGIAVMAGGKPCLVTRFPKISTPESMDRMVRFIREDIAALSESRRSYFVSLNREVEREERLHEIAQKLDEAEACLAAAM